MLSTHQPRPNVPSPFSRRPCGPRLISMNFDPDLTVGAITSRRFAPAKGPLTKEVWLGSRILWETCPPLRPGFRHVISTRDRVLDLHLPIALKAGRPRTV